MRPRPRPRSRRRARSSSPTAPRSSPRSAPPSASTTTMATDRGSRGLRPVDGASLAVARALFGALCAVLALRYLVHDWVGDFYYRPRHFFHFYGLDWVQPLAWPGMYVVFAIMVACGV